MAWAALDFAGSSDLGRQVNVAGTSRSKESSTAITRRAAASVNGAVGAVETPLALGVGVGAGAGIVGFGATALGAAAGSYAALQGQNQALTGGEIVPGNGAYGVPFEGPGLKEPGGKYLLKEWHIRVDSKDGDFDLQYYLTINDRGTKRIFMYNQRTKAWKSWPMPRLAVIGKNLPRHQMLTRLRRNLKRHQADAVTILKLVAPNKLESTRRPGGRYVRGRKRYID